MSSYTRVVAVVKLTTPTVWELAQRCKPSRCSKEVEVEGLAVAKVDRLR